MSSGCGDVLSLEDLKTAKKHQTFEAEVITGRAGGVSSGAAIDYATNTATGQIQKTMPAILRDIGFEPAGFDFTTGGTLSVDDRNKAVYDSVSDTWYSWSGTLPKIVAAGENPLSDTQWIPRTDPTLRGDLAAAGGAMMIGGLPAVTASSFGFTGSGNESALATTFLNYCIDNHKWAVVDINVNWDGLVFSRGGLNLTGQGVISGFVIIKGDTLKTRTNSVTIGTVNDYATYAAGTTAFPGNFSAYSVGDKIAIELASDTGFNGSINQIGVHFSTVVSASSSQLVIADGLRFAFDKFVISKTTFVKYSGALAEGTYTITGDFSSLSSGDVVRLENITGVDSVNAGTAYFEYSMVKSASASELVLVDPLVTACEDPIIVPMSFIKDVTITEANFEVLQLQYISSLILSNTRLTRSINGFTYRALYADLDMVGNTPTIMNFTYPRRTIINSVTVAGATGTTDNAAFKMMSPVDCTVNGVSAVDYGISSGTQSINGFYVDFLFTPYANWCRNVHISNVVTGKQKGGLGFWIDGVRGGSARGLHGTGDSRLFDLLDFDADVSANGGIFSRNQKRCRITPRANFLQLTGPEDVDIINAVLTGPNGGNANRSISIGGSASGPWVTTIAQNVRIIGGQLLSTNSADTGVWFQNVNNLEISGIMDHSGPAYSVNSSTSNVSGRICIGPHDLKNAINIGGYSGPYKIESDLAIGTKAATPPAYDRRRIQWGPNDWLFKSSVGILYKSGSEPASATDGYILSMKVPVPSTATSGGQAGQWASDGTYLYICTATNTWRRVAVAAW